MVKFSFTIFLFSIILQDTFSHNHHIYLLKFLSPLESNQIILICQEYHGLTHPCNKLFFRLIYL